jgi:RNA polymerase sigma-70 factor (ECF subfamily)
MPAPVVGGAALDLAGFYREESPRVLATLIRLLGDFDLAEEGMQEAFAVAVERWVKDGVPANPRAWLVSTGRHKAIDSLRRRQRLVSQQVAPEPATAGEPLAEEPEDAMLGDDRLRLIFTCCHPALPMEAQVALTLRTLCGLSTDEIASAFLVPVPTMAQRLVRAKQKIRDAGIPYRVPPAEDLAERLEAVMLVVYLVFNEGYNASSGDVLVRRELCAEAIRVGRLLCELMPAQKQPRALLALMLLHDSRRDARTDEEGNPIVLEDQDRSRWRRDQIEEGIVLAESAMSAGGPYAIQAAIAALHARAATWENTDWLQIVALYEALLGLQPSAIVELNHAAAVAMASGPAEGLRLLDTLESRAELGRYYLLPAARADLLRRLGRWQEAAKFYHRAQELAGNDATRRFLERRQAEVEAKLRELPRDA